MPDKVQDLIRAAAKQYGVPPELALAVAEQESGFNPTLVNPKKVKTAAGEEQAIGTFQFLPSTAKARGIDPYDPRQNIDGGAKYLRELMDKHQGDLDQVLAEYGGVKNDTNYVPSVQKRILRFQRRVTDTAPTVTTAPPAAATRGMLPPSTPALPATATAGMQPADAVTPSPEPQGFLRSMATAVDPRTSTGRENIAGAAGAIALGAATEGAGDIPIVLPWVIRLVGPVLGAAAAGATEATVEQVAQTAPPSATNIPEAGLRQGAYEAGGRILMGGGRRVLGGILASRVGKAASEALEGQLANARQVGAATIEHVTDKVRAAVDQVKTMATAAVEATRKAEGAQFRSLSREAKAAATATVAKKELDNAATLDAMTKQYDNLLAQPPSGFATGGAVSAAVGPGSPAKAALDAAGARVGTAAASGPVLDFLPVKRALSAMAKQARPDSIFGQAASQGIGFLRNAVSSGQKAAAQASGMFDQTALRKIIAQQLGVDETHPLPGLLGQLQNAPDQVSFADAHKIKMLLDEAVNWDRVAKKHLEAITKGVRITLRDTMAQAGHEEYETAAAAYHAMVPLYRKGVGKQILRAAMENPDALTKTLDPAKPAQALAARELLTTQASAGGDAATGQAAWDAVRSHFFYDKLLKGGVDGLSERVQTFFTTHPEFARVVLNDMGSQEAVSNMDKLGTAFATARDDLTQQLATTKTAAKSTMTSTLEGARQAAEQAITTTKASEAARVGATRISGAQDVRTARATARAATGAVRAKQVALRDSSLTRNTFEGQLANLIRVGGLGLKSIWGALSLVRLLEGPKAADIAEWAVYSSKNTQRLVDVLHSRVPDRIAANVIRDLYTTLGIRSQPPEPLVAPAQPATVAAP